jgi:hypothetical protein
MPIVRLIAISAILIAISHCVFAQDNPKPILVDEYTITACDDFLGRLDFYLWELTTHATSRGVIVLRNTPERRHRSVILQEMMKEHFKFRDFDDSRIDFIRVDGPNELRQFWRIPSGAEMPEIGTIALGYELSGVMSDPFILVTEQATYGICPEIDANRVFAAFLNRNKTARGNIVVRDDSILRARQKAVRILSTIEREFGISRKRLRIFPSRFQKASNQDEPVVEYWYLP